MFNNRATWRVEVTFGAAPPSRQTERASGVSEVEVDGHTIHCVVSGSFQPFLEALRGRGLRDVDPRPRDDGARTNRR